MRYHEAADFILDLRGLLMKPGTDATRELLGHLDDPHLGPDYIQIAGSNGKGSTARMLETTLRDAGLDVGLYTSPHMDDIRDRIRINDRPIPKSAVTAFVEATQDYIRDRSADGDSPTHFETLTAMALWHFGREDVDVAVLEVGIGGPLDATSVVDPVASAVTSVALEHTDVLGDTVEEIARDKAQVAPADRPLVTATTGAALAAVRDVAPDAIAVGEDVALEYGGIVDEREAPVTIEGTDWTVATKLALLGEHQARNAGVAATIAIQLGIDVAVIERGLRRATWPARFEIRSREPLVVLDGAHNPGACEALATTLDEFEFDQLHLVFGAMHDKDHGGMVDALPSVDHVITCRPDLTRAADQTVLARVFERHGEGEVRAMSAVESALDAAIEAAEPEDCVLVTGSLSTVGEARTRWSRVEIPKRVETLDDARAVLEGAHVTDAGIWRMRGKGVHRVLKTRVQQRQAQYLKEEMLSLGGECALSALNDQAEERFDVVLMGTLAQFKRLIGKLDAQPYGLAVVAEDIRKALGIQTEPATHGYPWESGTAIMGILNVTPDSFHDGGETATTEAAVERGREMAEAGAAIIDIGGESTRPGAEPVSIETELDRVIPVIEALQDLDVLLSIDSRKGEVARRAVEAGADIINDVSGLEDPEMRFVAADYDVPLVVMHSIDTPVVPGRGTEYDDVVEDVIREVRERVLLAEQTGLDRSKIIVDPGVGFGKSASENFELLGRVDELHALGCPVLVGHSHKSMFDGIGRAAGDREHASVAGTALAAARGADIIRVHDVNENVAAIQTVEAALDPRSIE
mgnify:FL=1